MIDDALPETNAALAKLMDERLRLRAPGGLAIKMKRGGKRLPHAQRKLGTYLVEQEETWQNPRLRRTIDAARVEQAQTDLRRYLKTLDPRDAFMGRVVGILAPLMFNILIIGIGLVIWLVATGRV